MEKFSRQGKDFVRFDISVICESEIIIRELLDISVGRVEEEFYHRLMELIMRRTNLPLVNEGEALFYIAKSKRAEIVVDKDERFQQKLDLLNIY